jgi:hypothetical protein
MANRAFLMLNLSGDPNEEYASEAVAAGASACYPVLWWSLFSQADIVLRTEEWEDDEGNPVPVSFPCPMTSLTIARKRAKARQRLFFLISRERSNRFTSNGSRSRMGLMPHISKSTPVTFGGCLSQNDQMLRS